MIYSIILAGGKQYKVSKGDIIDVDIDKSIEKDANIDFQVLLFENGDDNVEIGLPFVDGMLAKARVIGEVHGPKGIAFKYRSKKGYSRKVGYRQKYIRVEILDFVKSLN